MKHALAISLLSVALASPAIAEPTILEGVNLSRDVDCAGQDVVIAGQGNEIALTGSCGAVKVIGADHKVTFEKARSLEVSGASITVSGGSLEALALDVSENAVKATIASAGAPAEVRIFGAEQKSELRFASAATVVVGGYGNALDWSVDSGVKPPAISASGVDHKIKRR